MKMSKGSKVEISIDEDGFLGSYFEAKVIEIIGKDKFKVEYTTLLSDTDDEQLLREVVEAHRVRPVPPEIRVSSFDVLDKVDVYDGDGWWVGRVTGRAGRVSGKEGAFYTVYFDSTGDDLHYPFARMRVHQEFENGQWNPSQGKYNKSL